MRFPRTLLFGLAVMSPLFITACATNQQNSTNSKVIAYDPLTQARIRVFQGPAVYIHINQDKDQTCFPRDKTGAIHAAAGGFSMIAPSRSIGMPKTEGMPRSYREFVIPAGRLVVLDMYWSIDTQRCGPLGEGFIPLAGHDYETRLKADFSSCKIVLREIFQEGARVETRKAHSTPLLSCERFAN
jgi:hypothetical protein